MATDEGATFWRHCERYLTKVEQKAVKAYANDLKKKVTVHKLRDILESQFKMKNVLKKWNKKKLTEEIIEKLKENSKQ